MYTGFHLRARSQDENGSRVGERFRVMQLCVDSHVKVGWLYSNIICKAGGDAIGSRQMYARDDRFNRVVSSVQL